MRTFLPFFIKYLKIFTVIFCIGNVSILFIKWNLYIKLNLSRLFMSERSVRLLLEDILGSASKIIRYTGNILF